MTLKEYPWEECAIPEARLGGWLPALRHVASLGYRVVQLGMEDEPRLPRELGVSLLGQTALTEATAIMKAAAFHMGVEGGLVHFARCVDTRSIVVCGPTGAKQFGYSSNINLHRDGCTMCFWNPMWDREHICLRGYETCKNMPSTSELIHAVEEMARRDGER
jgi:ADP-heptose:LPS heptosyltransferase